MMIMVTGNNLINPLARESTGLIQCLETNGFQLRHIGSDDDGLPTYYFETNNYLSDVVVMGSSDVLKYNGLFDELAEALKKEDGVKIFLVNDKVAFENPAQMVFSNDELQIILELPMGTVYENGEKIPVDITIKNLTDKTIMIRTKKTAPVELDVKNLDQDLALNISGEKTADYNVFEIEPDGEYSQPITVNTGEFTGNILLIAKTVAIETSEGEVYYQTDPLSVIVK